ncbi:MAG TPA: LLM class F420-dependent oxidoreductase [Actinophytocola sp.]|jgi:probable F420-dependent oxidoreductase|nr:LLM class F420-dependent oxidoreductase [Actinophytocola sp.]
MKISVVAAAREDEQSPAEALDVAATADRLGFGEVWLGEGPTWDAFALAAAVGARTSRLAMTAGPVPVSVRDPFSIVRGAASVEAVTGRPTGVALGTSSTRVVEGVHGRSRATPVGDLRDCAAAYVAHRRGEWFGATGTHGFRRRLPAATGPLTIAAFGDRAIRIAARYADRMLLDLVSPAQVRALRAILHAATGRPPALAAWLPAAVDPDDTSYAQLMRALAGYLPVRGYQEMFAAAGFTAAVELANRGASPDELVAALPGHAARTVGLVGDARSVRDRIAEYAEAGLDEIAVVPATAGDPAGERTLTALAGPQ